MESAAFLPRLPGLLRLLLLALPLAACSVLPPNVQRSPSYALLDTADTAIGRVTAPLAAAHPRQSGALPLLDGLEAFAARWMLVESAQRTLDVQTYIWHADNSGTLFGRALYAAAERGVRVRILVDDGNAGGLDADIMALDAHPNIEVRLFNPFANRTWRVGDFLADFGRVHRRMHNKSFTADSQVTVVGGRNIGDEYLGVASAVTFADLDAMLVGSVVQEVAADFDEYWNSPAAYPARVLLRPQSDAELAEVRQRWRQRSANPEAERYLAAARRLSLLQRMRAGTLPLAWGTAYLLSDDPVKVLAAPGQSGLHLGRQLKAGFGEPASELLLVSPYFVPGRVFTDMLVGHARRGVRVAVLTNSLATTDVAPVHAGYLRYRDELLRGGVRLFELKASALPAQAREDEDRVAGLFGSRTGSSGASLHAKSFAIDRSRIFIGSYNLDPRSAQLNTEVGVLFESGELAGRLATLFDNEVPANAYELVLGPDGKVAWLEHQPGGAPIRHARLPGASGLKAWWIRLLSALPIEWLL